MSQENSVVLITGCGNDRGFGFAIAKAFASKGARLALADIMPLEAITELARRLEALGAKEAFAVRCDVSSEESVTSMVEHVFARFGRVDVLVNNAGIMRVSNFLDSTATEWDLSYNVMLKGTFLCTREVAKRMIEHKISGRIINMASVGGKRPWVYSAAYCACKAGIVSLTQVSATALAPFGINVNGIAPGDHKTDMLDVCYAEGAKLDKITPEEFKTRALSSIPLGHLGTTEDIAKMATFLASEDACFITGQVMNVNGGVFMQ